jgi:hypothetical protein
MPIVQVVEFGLRNHTTVHLMATKDFVEFWNKLDNNPIRLTSIGLEAYTLQDSTQTNKTMTVLEVLSLLDHLQFRLVSSLQNHHNPTNSLGHYGWSETVHTLQRMVGGYSIMKSESPVMMRV